jgi:geranylgeranyl diphosphate synthase type II
MRPWARTGECIGAAYQIADDMQDVLGNEKIIGKPVHVDAAHGRPNAVQDLGAAGALAKLARLIEEVVDTVPPCRHAGRFIDTIRNEAMNFLPKEIARSAA